MADEEARAEVDALTREVLAEMRQDGAGAWQEPQPKRRPRGAVGEDVGNPYAEEPEVPAPR
eukprot:3517803-Prorocentrum_lima.AAC.1